VAAAEVVVGVVVVVAVGRDIASREKLGPGGEKYHQDDRGPNDGVTKRKAERKTAEKED
jgi:hypothetical protein